MRPNDFQSIKDTSFEDNIQRVLDAAPIGMFMVNHQGIIVMVNSQLERQFAYTKAEMLGQSIELLVPERFRAAHVGQRAAFFTNPQTRAMGAGRDLCGRRKDASEFPVEIGLNPLPGENGVCVLASVIDITQRKAAEAQERKLEAQVLHSQKLESLGILAGGIAHDFNNILTSILGYADLVRMGLPGDSYIRGYIDELVNGAKRAADLTKQMLAYSGKGRFVVQPQNLSQLVEEMSRLLEISISKKCVLQYNFLPSLPSIEADGTQLRQVIMNLIINASEAIGEQSGVIALSTGVMHCDHAYLATTYFDHQLPEGLYVYLEVADTGCGMSDETVTRIFDPFFSTKFTGRGLGLAAVMGIVRGHRGAIKVYSELGRGTTFKLLFPPSNLPLSYAEKPSQGELWRGSGTVLIIDDEESVRGMVRHILESMGFDVLTASNGQEGVALFQQQAEQIQFVLLDMTMPKLDGVETFRELRRIRANVRTVLTSGYNEQTATSRFVGKGLAGFIQKPFNFEEMQKVIRKMLEE